MTLSCARRLTSTLALMLWGCTSYSYDYHPDGSGIDAGTGAAAGGSGGSGHGGSGGVTGAGSGGSAGGGSAGSDGGPEPAYMNVVPHLNDPLATANARRLMHFLTDSYGHTILSGQQELEYVEAVLAITGKEPALLGLDLIDYSPSRVAHGATSNAAEEAIDWWRERGGIVTLAWHWNAPSHLIDQEGQEWWRGFYTNATSFDLAAALGDPSSAEYQEILRDIDAIAVPLKQIADADVPVLFRPLHEASGGWFWWGAHGSEPYLALWGLLHDRLTLVHGLHNLIWVWNGQSASWYPGDATVDIVAEDIYATKRVYSPELEKFENATTYSAAPKLVALSETGALPDPDRLVDTGAAWSWFCGWSETQYISDETWNEDAMKRKVYSHEYVTTLDELPDIASYPLAAER
ncbi:MAG TPA: glycosyl hydrolase [Polyangiaceae bacterium]|nr:glycosyl hydrolase [Polyangiaceae bacterium]